ncbi:MAG: phasin family protein [Pseudomonadota bacterium]|nr:phasin family protein [Pseudomonadota bacterium]
MADSKQFDTQPYNNPASAGAAAARSGLQAASEATRQNTEAMQQGGRAVGDALRRGSEAGAEAVQRAGDATSERMRTASATLGGQAVADGQRQMVRDAAEKFQQVSRKMAEAVQGTTEDMRTMMVLPNAANGGLQDLQQSMTGLIEGIVRTNLRASQELFRLANPSAFIELQQRFVRDYLDALMEGSATLVRATRRTADETLRPLEAQIEHRQQARRSEHHYQNAAE